MSIYYLYDTLLLHRKGAKGAKFAKKIKKVLISFMAPAFAGMTFFTNSAPFAS